MKVLDIVHRFNDGNSPVSSGLCRVRTFVVKNDLVVLLTDLGENNDGRSVTNAVEGIVESLKDQGLIVSPATLIEHYEGPDFNGDSFDIVNLSPRTSWIPVSRNDVLALIGLEEAELKERTSANSRVMALVSNAKQRRDPFGDLKSPDGNKVTTRRLEIIRGMISKSTIESLVSAGAGEQEIQRVLKTDLSIFGEAYAEPNDEYICFSEFPLAGGLIDFAVFTARSRMNIILIEIKGAEFDLVNSNHYKAFNHKINEAAGQIKERLGIISRNLTEFRKIVHGLRERVERGDKLRNSFLGPCGKLCVSSDKDVIIRSVIIGGRTRDDLEESKKRHDFETGMTPPIQIESWDTWLRKLKRA
ncbi:MAG: DUF4263 domain-containing protein [Elusimicrobia bacterium]|nr:DUF4263 domain-containing protein [Elusimicrobiota bacterium]